MVPVQGGDGGGQRSAARSRPAGASDGASARQAAVRRGRPCRGEQGGQREERDDHPALDRPAARSLGSGLRLQLGLDEGGHGLDLLVAELGLEGRHLGPAVGDHLRHLGGGELGGEHAGGVEDGLAPAVGAVAPRALAVEDHQPRLAGQRGQGGREGEDEGEALHRDSPGWGARRARGLGSGVDHFSGGGHGPRAAPPGRRRTRRRAHSARASATTVTERAPAASRAAAAASAVAPVVTTSSTSTRSRPATRPGSAAKAPATLAARAARERPTCGGVSRTRRSAARSRAARRAAPGQVRRPGSAGLVVAAGERGAAGRAAPPPPARRAAARPAPASQRAQRPGQRRPVAVLEGVDGVGQRPAEEAAGLDAVEGRRLGEAGAAGAGRPGLAAARRSRAGPAPAPRRRPAQKGSRRPPRRRRRSAAGRAGRGATGRPRGAAAGRSAAPATIAPTAPAAPAPSSPWAAAAP